MKINSKTFVATAALSVMIAFAAVAAVTQPAPLRAQPAASEAQVKGAKDAEPSTELLLGQAREKYESLEMFAASGEVETVSEPKKSEAGAVETPDDASPEDQAIAAAMGKRTTMRATFQMWLKRDDKFRLEWEQAVFRDVKQGGQAWSVGESYNYQPRFKNEPHEYESMDQLFGTIQGVASGIPAVPRVFYGLPSILSRMANPQLNEEEIIEGEPCYVVSGTQSEASQITAWIAKESYLIKRYRIVFDQSKMTQPPPQSEEHEKLLAEHPELKRAEELARRMVVTWTTTFRDVRINEEIADEQLRPVN